MCTEGLQRYATQGNKLELLDRVPQGSWGAFQLRLSVKSDVSSSGMTESSEANDLMCVSKSTPKPWISPEKNLLPVLFGAALLSPPHLQHTGGLLGMTFQRLRKIERE